MLGRLVTILWVRQCRFHQLKKFRLRDLPSVVFRPPASLYRSTVLVRTNMHAVSVCVSNPLNYDMDYRIFNVPTYLLTHA